MKGIRVRPLLQSDLEQINQLHRTRDDVAEKGAAEKRTELLEWLAFHNPFAGNEATYFVAEDEGNIVAFQGRMPLEFIVNGTRRKGYYVHDTYVHPEYRKKGVGFSLITALAQATEEQSDSFFCLLGGTPLNLKIQRRMGYLELPPAPQYVKLLNPKKQLSRILKLQPLVALLNPVARAGLRLIDTFLLALHSPSSRTVRSVERFDHRVDELVDRIRGKLGVSSYKNSDYLNWRYVDRPYKTETLLIAEENARLTGCMVLTFNPYRPEARVGVIIDVVTDPNDLDTLTALCSAAIRFFISRKANAISCIITNTHVERAFTKFAFRSDSTGKAVLVGNLGKAGRDKTSLGQVENWNLTRGDSDGFMLT